MAKKKIKLSLDSDSYFELKKISADNKTSVKKIILIAIKQYKDKLFFDNLKEYYEKNPVKDNVLMEKDLWDDELNE